MTPKARKALADQEKLLGSPFDRSQVLNFRDIVGQDEREEFPERSCAEFERLGFARWMLPQELGGHVQSLEEFVQTARLMGRRDLSVATAKGKCVLASLPTWIAGSDHLKKRISEVVLKGQYLSLALTEQGNGSDLTQSQVQATKQGDSGFLITGEKWLINNATQSTCISVLARTNPAGGIRGFSLFLLDKEKTDATTFRPLPKIRTLGVRGIDISGLTFCETPVTSADLIGREGQGLEAALKTLQVSRTMCAGFCLGPLETMLRIVFEFSQKRKLYGDSILKIPNVRSRLARNSTDLLICELLVRAGTRLFHLRPELCSLSSAVTKYLVPKISEQAISELCTTLGARYYLREGFSEGIAQKFFRDIQLIGLFDGSSQVNLYVIANQLRVLAEQRKSPASVQDWSIDPALLADVSNLPLLDYRRLQLTNRGEDPLLAGLLAAMDRFPGNGIPPQRWLQVSVLLRKGLADLDSDTLSGDPRETANHRQAFDRAHRLCWLHAAALGVLAQACEAGVREEEISLLLHRCFQELGVVSPFSETEVRACEDSVILDLQRRVEGDLSLGLSTDPVSGWYGHLSLA